MATDIPGQRATLLPVNQTVATAAMQLAEPATLPVSDASWHEPATDRDDDEHQPHHCTAWHVRQLEYCAQLGSVTREIVDNKAYGLDTWC